MVCARRIAPKSCDFPSNVLCSIVACQSPDSSNWFLLAELHQSLVTLIASIVSVSTSSPVPTSESQYKLRLHNSKGIVLQELYRFGLNEQVPKV